MVASALDSNAANISELLAIINKFFNVAESFRNESYIEYVVISSKGDINESFNKLYDELVMLSYYPILYNAGGITVLRVVSGGKSRTNTYKVPLILFSLTLASVLITGYFIVSGFYSSLASIGYKPLQGSIIYEMMFFTLSVLFPLVMHELGHWLIVRKSNIPASYPIFIPAPFISPLGTFGAIAMMRFLPKNLAHLLRLGISGPLLGFTASLAFFMVNYLLSPKLPVEAVLAALNEGLLRYVEITPLSVYLIMNLITAPNAGLITILNPAAYASLIMILIHFINLLPIGQLDGGHVVRGITSTRTHSIVSITTALTMILLSLISTLFFGSTFIWLGVFALLALFISGFGPHVGAANMLYGSVPKDVKVKVVLIYILLLTFSAPLPSM